MSKQYTLPEDEQPAMVGEPVVAERATLSRHTALKYRTRDDQELSYDSPDAPCQYSINEVKAMLAQSRQDYKKGRVHSTEEVQRMVFDRIDNFAKKVCINEYSYNYHKQHGFYQSELPEQDTFASEEELVASLDAADEEGYITDEETNHIMNLWKVVD